MTPHNNKNNNYTLILCAVIIVAITTSLSAASSSSTSTASPLVTWLYTADSGGSGDSGASATLNPSNGVIVAFLNNGVNFLHLQNGTKAFATYTDIGSGNMPGSPVYDSTTNSFVGPIQADKVYCFDAATGSLRWKGGSQTTAGAPASPAYQGLGQYSDRVYMLMDQNGFVSFRISDGKVGWSAFSSNTFQNKQLPLVLENEIVICDDDGNMETHTLDEPSKAGILPAGSDGDCTCLSNGQVAYHEQTLYFLNEGDPQQICFVNYKTGSSRGPPITTVGSTNGNFDAIGFFNGSAVFGVQNYAVSVSTSEFNKIYSNKLTPSNDYESATSAPSIDSYFGLAIFALPSSEDATIIAISVATGAMMWKYEVGSISSGTPNLLNGSVVAVVNGYKVVALTVCAAYPTWPTSSSDGSSHSLCPLACREKYGGCGCHLASQPYCENGGTDDMKLIATKCQWCEQLGLCAPIDSSCDCSSLTSLAACDLAEAAPAHCKWCLAPNGGNNGLCVNPSIVPSCACPDFTSDLCQTAQASGYCHWCAGLGAAGVCTDSNNSQCRCDYWDHEMTKCEKAAPECKPCTEAGLCRSKAEQCECEAFNEQQCSKATPSYCTYCGNLDQCVQTAVNGECRCEDLPSNAEFCQTKTHGACIFCSDLGGICLKNVSQRQCTCSTLTDLSQCNNTGRNCTWCGNLNGGICRNSSFSDVDDESEQQQEAVCSCSTLNGNQHECSNSQCTWCASAGICASGTSCGCGSFDELNCRFANSTCRWCKNNSLCAPIDDTSCSCYVFDEKTCESAAPGSCRWCRGVCANPDAGPTCSCHRFSDNSTVCNRATGCKFCENLGVCLDTASSMATPLCSCENLVGKAQCADSHHQCRWCPESGLCAPLWDTSCSCYAFQEGACRAAASGSCGWCGSRGVCGNASLTCSCDSFSDNITICKQAKGCHYCENLGLCGPSASCSCSDLPDKARCDAAGSACRWCSAFGTSGICTNNNNNNQHDKNEAVDSSCSCASFSSSQCQLPSVSSQCTLCDFSSSSNSNEQKFICTNKTQNPQCLCEFAASTSSSCSQLPACKFCDTLGVCTNATSNSNSNQKKDVCSCDHFTTQRFCNLLNHSECSWCNFDKPKSGDGSGSSNNNDENPETDGVCVRNSAVTGGIFPTCSCFSFTSKAMCLRAEFSGVGDGRCALLPVISDHRSASLLESGNISSSNSNDDDDDISSRESGVFCAPYSTATCAPLTCEAIGGQRKDLCIAAGCKLQGTECLSSECITFFLPRFVPQSFLLLVLGVAKDLIVLLIFSATSRVQRTMAKCRIAIKRCVNSIFNFDRVAPSELDETVYYSDSVCRDGYNDDEIQPTTPQQLLVRQRDFAHYVARVCDELFFWASPPTESMRQKLFDTVAFSLVSEQRWIELDGATNKKKISSSAVNDTENTPLIATSSEQQLQQNDDDNNDDAAQSKQKHPNRQRRRKLRPQTLERNLPAFHKLVDRVVAARTTSHVFYSASRSMTVRITSTLNSFPDSTQLLFFVVGIFTMFAAALITVLTHKSMLIEIAQGCSDAVAQSMLNPQQGQTTTARTSSTAAGGINTTSAASSSDTSARPSIATIAFFLLGFRLVNSSSFATAALVCVKFIRCAWQARRISSSSSSSNNGVDSSELSLERKLPIFSVTSSRGVQLLLVFYFCLVAPFALVGIFYSWSQQFVCGVPVLVGAVLLVLDYFLVGRLTREDDPFESSDPGDDDEDEDEEEPDQKNDDEDDSGSEEQQVSDDDDDEEEALKTVRGRTKKRAANNNKKVRAKLPVSSPPAPSAAAAAAASSPVMSPRGDDDDDDDQQQSPVSSTAAAAAATASKATKTSKNKTRGSVAAAADHAVKAIEQDHQNKTIPRAILESLVSQQLPVLVLTLALQFSFNATALLSFRNDFNLDGDPTQVFERDADGRSISCAIQLLEGDLSAALAFVSSFCPFL